MTDQPPLFQPSPADGVAAERAVLLAALDEHEAALDAIDAAIAKIGEGTYGRCAECGALLPDDLLEEDPLRSSCGERCPGPPPPESDLAGDGDRVVVDEQGAIPEGQADV